jgi:hypothetical protein
LVAATNSDQEGDRKEITTADAEMAAVEMLRVGKAAQNVRQRRMESHRARIRQNRTGYDNASGILVTMST